ncbi:STE/STE20/TAO protein kinase [Loa loa]|uniref:non-specific serine/threonine protein kinase n=1 Tax=Loa loa TaxID=7209 RepID=A0A1S0U684_LOALO|nr:STE/STE20/TAO protein kinase [Loa loa]EFO25500.1 STE/STE20/TAO protein kinase [Loa loa]
MPAASTGKPGSLKDPTIASLFSVKDPEQRFEDLREIGHGSFGAVFFAQDLETNTTVAIKKMAFSGKQSAEKWSDIIKEVSFLKNIKHENIVEYRACYLKEHTCWLVMEYCIGSAADIVEVHRTPIRECEIAAIMEQTLFGLSYLHKLGRIHRDVKAGNILLTDNGIVKLADFGSASTLCPAQSFVGTPYWMAPEVILAMDEGHYDQSADIWSLGITCIELAERRPPLFNMNAMSALYHIAQNDPPTLSRGENSLWSADFHSFVDLCLRKDPRERMKTGPCQQHPFIMNGRLDGVILELITRTKALVSDLDNFQYRKMRKLVYLDEQQSAVTDDTITTDRHDVDEELSGMGGSASSRSNSISSFQSYHSSAPISDSHHGDSGKVITPRPLIPLRVLSSAGSDINSTNENLDNIDKGIFSLCEIIFYKLETNMLTNRTVIHVDDGGSHCMHSMHESLFIEETSSGTPTSTLVSDETTRPINEEMATLRRSKFSTLRTTKLISKELEEYNRENNIYEQMSGYKRLRQQHQKELKQLEERCAMEMESFKQKADKEYENLLNAFSKELQRLRSSQSAEKDKKLREYDETERRLRRQLNSRHENELKAFSNAQKKEYKHNKERAKVELKERYSMRSAYESALKETKAVLNARRTDAEAIFSREQKIAMENEIRRLKGVRMIEMHTLTEKLIVDELKFKGKQLETSHALLRKHHEQTKQLELSLLIESQRMKRRHLEKQHEAETSNQLQYNQRVTDETVKRHALQSKQQPKELKAKELQIRKQYRQAVKTQLRQSKLLQAQVLSCTPKEEHREMILKLKEEQKRKLATLAGQYESTIESLLRDLTVKLESWQEDELKALKEKLEKEMDMLKDFQNRQKSCLEENCKREEQKLAERTSIRKAVIEKKMEEEKVSLETERQKTLKAIEEKHRIEKAAFFDDEQKSLNEHTQQISSSASQFSSQDTLCSISSNLHSLATNS